MHGNRTARRTRRALLVGAAMLATALAGVGPAAAGSISVVAGVPTFVAGFGDRCDEDFEHGRDATQSEVQEVADFVATLVVCEFALTLPRRLRPSRDGQLQQVARRHNEDLAVVNV